MGFDVLLGCNQMNSAASLLLSLLPDREQPMSKLANLFQNVFFIHFIQNILALTDTKLMTQESRVSNYPICSDKDDQVQLLCSTPGMFLTIWSTWRKRHWTLNDRTQCTMSNHQQEYFDMQSSRIGTVYALLPCLLFKHIAPAVKRWLRTNAGICNAPFFLNFKLLILENIKKDKWEALV